MKAGNSQRGFTLIEFMIASTLSLIVVAALTAMLVSSSRARDELQRANQQTENGRYAMQVLADDIQLAGYFAEYDLDLGLSLAAAGETPHPSPADKPDPCAISLSGLTEGMALHVQGYDNVTASPVSCISDVLDPLKEKTDILVIRRVSTCVNGATGCSTVASAPYFQASLCESSTELGSTPKNATAWFRLSTTLANLDRRRKDCTAIADRRRLVTHIYFISKHNDLGDEIPTLKLAELRGATFTITPIVEGIENLQLEYGIDTDLDGTPEAYTANPDTFNSCADANCRRTNWHNVLSAKIYLLSRSTSFSPGHEDSKTYSMGKNADGSPFTIGPNPTDDVVLSTTDRTYKRHLFETLARMHNPAGRNPLARKTW